MPVASFQRTAALAMLACASMATQAGAQSSNEGVVLVQAGRLLDRPGQAPRNNATVVIRNGKRADLIAVAGDPLADVKVLKQVAFVMKNGRIYKQ